MVCSMSMRRSDKPFYALPAVGGQVAQQTTAAVADGARGGASGRMEVPGCFDKVAQIAGDARVRREAEAEALRWPEGRHQSLVDGGLEPVQLQEDQLLGGIVSERDRPNSV